MATADFITPVCDDPHLFGRIARGSQVGLRMGFDTLPVHEGFYEMVAAGVTTGATAANATAAELLETGHRAAEIGEVTTGPVGLEIT